MNKKILYRFLPFLLSLVVVFLPIKAAAATSDDYLEWDGSVTFEDDRTYVYLNAVLASYNADTVLYARTTYEGKTSNILRIDELVPGTVLNGYLTVFGSASVSNSLPDGAYYNAPQIQFNSSPNDGIMLGGYMRSFDSGSCNFAVKIYFDNYLVNNNFIEIPFNLDVQQSINYVHSAQYPFQMAESLLLTFNYSTDHAGELDMYYNLNNVPTIDGHFSQQNQTIINQGQTQNNLTTQQNSLIQNQTNQQHQDSQSEINQGIANSQAEINQGIANSQAQINQSIQNTDQITNGYNSSQMGDAENKFESGAGDLTDIEDTLTDSSSSYVDNFTDSGFDTSFLQSVGPSLNYVVTWFTNFWNMGGALTSTYGLSFAIFIAFYILRVRG